ncbi:sugar ABC transporter permease [Pseudomonas sp. MAFF 730085]|uniref:sn-glycerol-3-phosphate transport system permease protein UgpA n=1 Tax=Pseudomonas kitaguniensis TaxID=2607908 RepID=A0A5N7JTH9_9PSED|nr:sugar ABC transporter permease [Pseudomonas kitaguniensis]MPQ84533.1 sugar ABC transporter permease [Pseudomonas kitaguniensis]
MSHNAQFSQRFLPLLLAFPQLLAVLLFFYWPTVQALWWSFHYVQPFGGSEVFAGLANYVRVLNDPSVLSSLGTTLVFSLFSTLLALAMALVLAACLQLKVRGYKIFSNVLIWPYAVSGATLGIIFQVLANPIFGPLAWINHWVPEAWAPSAKGWQAMTLLVLAYAWCQLPFNIVMIVASLQSVPEDCLAAAALDGASPWQRLRDIQLPMVAPYLFFVFVVGLLDSLSNSFGLVERLTHGGPGNATEILAFKIYQDGFVGIDLAGSSTLSVLMLVVVVVLSVTQYRYLAWRNRRREHHG